MLSSQEQLPDNHEPLCRLAKVGGGNILGFILLQEK